MLCDIQYIWGLITFLTGLCNDKDKDGTIGWIAFAVATVVITVEKWFSTKNFGTTIVALISYVLIQLSLHTAPIKCVVDNSRKSDSNAIEIVQTCCGALFFLLYLIIILHKKLQTLVKYIMMQEKSQTFAVILFIKLRQSLLRCKCCSKMI